MENRQYNFREVEKKWQERWEKEGIYRAEDFSERPKKYILIEFPYPSGAGLHAGHVRSYTALDVVSRKLRMQGFNVLYPIGWDAFGLPTENYAIKNKIHPRIATEQNVATFTRQIKSLGISFDWSREINTTDPQYYKWTQWIFLQLFKHGLAYKASIPINWCPSCKIGLANEEVVNGKCERCGAPAEKREKEQWMLAITKYADRLIDDLETVDYLERIKSQQINWIGHSEGAAIKFKVQSSKFNEIEVFTTRPDTLWGCTYLAVSPEHELLQNQKSFASRRIKNQKEVEEYIKEARRKTEMERVDLSREKTGVRLEGIMAVNPANGEEIPVFAADYILSSYGTGAIMAVPAHDERDFEFARRYNLPIKTVIEPVTGRPYEGEENKKSIVAIVQDPKNKKLLSINWGSALGGNLFIGGGLEEGEDPIDCAMREIKEETGYKNVRLISQSEKVHHHYFAHSKNKYKSIEVLGFYFELINDEKLEQKLENDEAGKFKAEWIDIGEAEKKVQDSLHKYLFEKFIKGNIFTGGGILADSGEFSGLDSEEAKEKIIQWLEENKIGERKVNYKLRDWVFSRQHYWGEPIPIVYCDKCAEKIKNHSPAGESKIKKGEFSKGELLNPGWIADKNLPLSLPDVEFYEPAQTGESPLANIMEWVNTVCPKCGGPAKRETDTMPNWAGSSWYFLRYADPKNDKALADPGKMKYWMPVDLYNGGMEHTTLHLLYSRFWNKFLFDIGAVPASEPYAKRVSHGMILAEDGRKMSKSLGNVINPDEIIDRYGADALRVYEMFMGPYDEAIAWNMNGVNGVFRFLEKINKLKVKSEKLKVEEKNKLNILLYKTIKKVTEDIEGFKFNTAISAMMILVNEMEKADEVAQEDYEKLLILISPFAPHIAEELWEKLDQKESIFKQAWPSYDPELIKEEELEIPVQINGKVRDIIKVSADAEEEKIKRLALESEKIVKWMEGKEAKKVIYIKGKMVSVVK